VKADEALAQMQRESPRDAWWFKLYGRVVIGAQLAVVVSILVMATGSSRRGAAASGLDLTALGAAGFWTSLISWYVLARGRSGIAQRNRIALDGFAPRFDPVARLRSSRAFGTRLAALWVAVAAGVGAEMAWSSGALTLLAAAAAFGAVVLASRFVPIFVAPSGAISAHHDSEAARYRGAPTELPADIVSGIRCERRAKLPAWLAVIVLALLCVPGAGGVALVAGLVAAPVVVPVLESRAFARAGRSSLRLRGTQLIASDSAGHEVAAIDLTRPFTYQVLSQADLEAAYRLDQDGQRVEFTSESELAPWLVRDVLKRDWPPRDRAAWDAA